MTEPAPKPLVWMGQTRQQFQDLPGPVRSLLGYALYAAQLGGKHRNAKPLKGFGGAGVLEIVKDHQGDTFRAIYTVRLAGKVYVLHVFQKKSKTGSETPKPDAKLIETRLRDAERIAKGEGK